MARSSARLFGNRQRCLRILFLIGFLQVITVVVYTRLHTISAYLVSYSGLHQRNASRFVCSPVLGQVLPRETNDTQLSNDERCIRKFLNEYDMSCEEAIHRFNKSYVRGTDCLCPCVPQTLEGPLTRRQTFNVTDVENDVIPGISGGHWMPVGCVARQRIAIIVPYRERLQHLRAFLADIHPMLQRQQVEYTIYLIEQRQPALFNKAMLMNAGFATIRQRDKYDCFIFHDVDMIPLDDRNFFTCSSTPRHVAGYVDKWGFATFYDRMFGGAVAFSENHFVLVNGYSNTFYGWGGEDDDMYQRTRAKNVTLHPRFPVCVGKYRMFSHSRDFGNPSLGRGALGWQYRPDDYKVNGLNSLVFTLVGLEQRSLFTKVIVDLPTPPADISAIFRERQQTQINSLYKNVTTVGLSSVTTQLPTTRSNFT